jgi:hypothetical protein
MAPDTPQHLATQLPATLAPVVRLAFNLRWVWNHGTDRVWEALNAEVWLQTRNPILVIQNTPRSRFDELAHDAEFVERVRRLDRHEAEYLSRPSWFQRTYALEPAPLTAYFSMEYGISDALPLYSGGLGVLAGDHLKTASDLGVPLVAVGLFYREGYFRQMLDADGAQLEIYAVNSRESLPVRLVTDREDMPLRVTIELPGRDLRVRIWRADVGRVPLYLLDSDDPLNSPFDRGITAKLYAGDREARLMQESVLGIGGWRALEALGLDVEVCHLNEGHAALATIERARCFAAANDCDFFTALWPRAAATSSRPTRRSRRHSILSAAADAEVWPGLRAPLRDPAGPAGRPGARRSGRSHRTVQHGVPGSTLLRARQRRERAAQPREPQHFRAVVSALARDGSAGDPRDERCARSVVGFAVGGPVVDRRLRQGALARRARAPRRRRGAVERRPAVGLPRHGAPRPGGLRATPSAAAVQPAWRRPGHHGSRA